MNDKVAQQQKFSGFTLVELIIVLVIAGLILVAAIKGQDLVKNARAKVLHSRLIELQIALLRFYDMKGRWPGDCNRDGVIKAWVNSWVPSQWDFRADTNPLLGSCLQPDDPTNPDTIEADYDTPFSDMRLVGILPPNIPNREIARHPFGHYFAIGFAGLNWDLPGNPPLPNIIVAYNIPIWAARMIDVMIDGTVNSTAGRIRKTAVVNAPDYGDLNVPENQLTHIAFYFERPP